MAALLQVGLVDTLSAAQHDGPRSTWAQTATDMNRNHKLRIDYILVLKECPHSPVHHAHLTTFQCVHLSARLHCGQPTIVNTAPCFPTP